MAVVDNSYEFLREITASNLSKVEANFQFKFNGYTTLYVVDTYDIIEFCFPLLFNTSSQQNSPLDISTFLSYHFFFFDFPTRPVLLNEYKVELFSIWYRLRKNISKFSNYNNIKKSMVGQYQSLKMAEEKIAFIESNVSLLLAIAYGSISKSPIDRYNKVIQRFQVDSLDIEDIDDRKIVEDVFFDTKPNLDTVNATFDKFCNAKKFSLADMTEEERTAYLENTYRDIKVFDRIININSALEMMEARQRLKGRYNVLYLSSAGKKTEIIEKSYRDYPSSEIIASDSIHRTNIEVYLYRLLNLGEEKKATIINFLEQLKTVSRIYSSNSAKIDRYKILFKPSERKVKNKLFAASKDFDDIFLKYHNIKGHLERISEGIKKLRKTGNEAELLAEFINILERASTDENKVALAELEKSFQEYNLSMNIKSNIVSDISYLSEKLTELKIQTYPGKDTVRSRVQSFPILLFHQKKNIREIQKLFYEIIAPDGPNSSALRTLIETPKHLLYEFTALERKLFFLFVRYLFDSHLTEDAIIAELDEYLELNKKGNMNLLQTEPDKMDVAFRENTSLRNDLIYFKTWVFRRNNHHDKAIELINYEQKDTGNLDPRLYHSRALCYKNRFYHERHIQSADILSDYLAKALYNFEYSELSFKSWLDNDEHTILMPHLLVAISNSIIDTFTKLYLLDTKKYEDKIAICRIRLNAIKREISKSSRDIHSYPAFEHTEIDLEYCEAMVAYSNGQIKQSQFKIQNSNTRVEKLINSGDLTGHEPFEQSVLNVRKLATFLLRIDPSNDRV